MPSQEHLNQKQAIVGEISEKMSKASSVVIIDYIGITVDQANMMRRKLREVGVDYKVYKNTLVKRAIEGTPNAGLADLLDGPNAFVFGYDDATAPARVIDSVIKEFKKMKFKAGMVEGVLYDDEGIRQIALIPSRDILIARFMGSIQNPIGKLVRTFKAIADADGKDEAITEAEAPVETAPEAKEPAVDEAPAEEAVAEAVVEEKSEEEAPEVEAVAEEESQAADEPVETAPEAKEPAVYEAPAEEAVAEAAVEEKSEEEAPEVEAVVEEESQAADEPAAAEAPAEEEAVAEAAAEEAAEEETPVEEAAEEESQAVNELAVNEAPAEEETVAKTAVEEESAAEEE